MKASHFRKYWMRPILLEAKMWSLEAERLMMMTAAMESQFLYVRQLESGPARGFFQMEPATFKDLLTRLENNPDRLRRLQYHIDPHLDFKQCLERDITVMVLSCRYMYAEIPERLPCEVDNEGMWLYYKKYWNTRLGDTTREEFFAAWAAHGDD